MEKAFNEKISPNRPVSQEKIPKQTSPRNSPVKPISPRPPQRKTPASSVQKQEITRASEKKSVQHVKPPPVQPSKPFMNPRPPVRKKSLEKRNIIEKRPPRSLDPGPQQRAKSSRPERAFTSATREPEQEILHVVEQNESDFYRPISSLEEIISLAYWNEKNWLDYIQSQEYLDIDDILLAFRPHPKDLKNDKLSKERVLANLESSAKYLENHFREKPERIGDLHRLGFSTDELDFYKKLVIFIADQLAKQQSLPYLYKHFGPLGTTYTCVFPYFQDDDGIARELTSDQRMDVFRDDSFARRANIKKPVIRYLVVVLGTKQHWDGSRFYKENGIVKDWAAKIMVAEPLKVITCFPVINFNQLKLISQKVLNDYVQYQREQNL